MAERKPSKYWLDVAADQIIKRFPEGEIIVSSGISPSADYHIGHFREIMTAEALAWAVRRHGREARHVHVVDNFDPLRKWYDFLPSTDKDYGGRPVCLIPDPYGDCHLTYADHFFSIFEENLESMGVGGPGFEIIRSYEDLYKPGRMNDHIETVLEKLSSSNLIHKTFEEISNRQLPADWTPVQLLKDGKFVNGSLRGWDKKAKTLDGVSYLDGSAKLNWRLDWPARWKELKVNVEPFGAQEHGAAGGSYDTGKEFAEKVFNVQAPLDPARYGHIHRTGETIKMSSSRGNGITPAEALDIMPPEILRYFIVRSRPENKLFFDEGQGLYNLVDEFAAAGADQAHPFRDAYEFAAAANDKLAVSTVPFKHLIQVYQAARGEEPEVMSILERTGYEEEVKTQAEVIRAELPFIKNWLAKYAPDGVKFAVQTKLPQADLDDSQRKFLDELADLVDKQPGMVDGQTMHELIYAAKDKAKLGPKEAFQALYRVILGKDYGPKAGWFLSSLEKNWLLNRLRLKK